MIIMGAHGSGSNDARAEAAAEAEAAHHEALIEDHRAVVEAPPWGSARPRLEPGSHRLEARRLGGAFDSHRQDTA